MANQMKVPAPEIVVAQAATALLGAALASLTPREQKMAVGVGLIALGYFVLASIPNR